MRHTGQIAQRVQRAAIANELILWMEMYKKTSGHRAFPMLIQFTRTKGYETFEAWKAWEILKEAGRLNRDHRHGWELLESMPVVIDKKGDLIRNV